MRIGIKSSAPRLKALSGFNSTGATREGSKSDKSFGILEEETEDALSSSCLAAWEIWLYLEAHS